MRVLVDGLSAAGRARRSFRPVRRRDADERTNEYLDRAHHKCYNAHTRVPGGVVSSTKTESCASLDLATRTGWPMDFSSIDLSSVDLRGPLRSHALMITVVLLAVTAHANSSDVVTRSSGLME